MTEPRTPALRALALPLILLALGLAVLPAVWPAGAVAIVGPWLAQPLMALGMALLSPAPEAPARRLWWRDGLTLLVLWGATIGLMGLGLAWPYTGLLQTGALGSALGLGAVAGLAWTVLWRQWTLFAFAARKGGGLGALGAAVPGTWSLRRGLLLSLGVLFASAGAWLLVWPSTTPCGRRRACSALGGWPCLMPLRCWASMPECSARGTRRRRRPCRQSRWW